jgi:hypothetical protein
MGGGLGARRLRGVLCAVWVVWDDIYTFPIARLAIVVGGRIVHAKPTLTIERRSDLSESRSCRLDFLLSLRGDAIEDIDIDGRFVKYEELTISM